jgi:GNAT superfamily N-acetyltransferase
VTAAAVASQVEIHPVNTREAAREFLEFPYGHYSRDVNWVAPLRIDQRRLFNPNAHPFWKHADMQRFLAYRDGIACGRIAAIHDQFAGEVGSFGFFESVDSELVAQALFDAAAAWLAARGLKRMRGPLNPSINYECGLLVSGFDSPPRVMMTYNPPNYPRLIEAAGLLKAHDLWAYRLTITDPAHWDRLERARRLRPSMNGGMRPVRMNDYENELDQVWRIYSSAWSENWGAVPLTQEELRFLGKELKPILIPELALFCEVAGEPIAFGLLVPDINEALLHARGSLFPTGLLKILYHKSRIRKYRALALGIMKDYRNTSIGADLYLELARTVIGRGAVEVECSWISETNGPMNRALEFMGAKRYKTYRIYERALGI